MVHKIVKLKRGFPYTETTVPFEHSLLQIQDMLERYGCARIGTMREIVDDIPHITMVFEHYGLQYMIEFPITYKRQARSDKLMMAISGRIIHNRIKALLVNVEIEYIDFSQAMMPYLLLPDPTGKPQTLEEYVKESKNQLMQGEFTLHYLPPSRGED